MGLEVFYGSNWRTMAPFCGSRRLDKARPEIWHYTRAEGSVTSTFYTGKAVVTW